MLVTVLIITAVGLLFGAGALLLFRFQCEKRIDRQHELEKVYAVRSALNFIRTYDKDVDDVGMAFGYRTGSGRDLGLLVKPVKAIFPDPGNSKHFDMGRGDGNFQLSEQYDQRRDYEYGALGVTGLVAGVSISSRDGDSRPGLAFRDRDATNSVKWWVNIGMSGTGGWLQEDYGRRYFFTPLAYVKGERLTNDIMRLCIIRNVTNENIKAGSRHGWPLSSRGERSLVFQVSPMASGSNTNNAEITLWEYEHTGAAVTSRLLIRWPNCPSLCPVGIQIAGDRASLFYIGNASKNANNEDDGKLTLSSRGYTFSATRQLPADIYKYFSDEVTIGSKTYGGLWTNNVTGKVEAPELRAVFEIEAASDSRKPGAPIDASNEDFLTDFRVTPAYQYDVFLEHPACVTNRATVAQKIGKYSRLDRGTVGGYTMLTYDTHGTEHKGFRQDEREQARSGGR